jgi:pimeloyl-ACP methyl ester carboxylesterase
MSRTQRTAVLENSVDICRSADEVFDYCSDPLRETEWNPKLKHIEKSTVGPVEVGARYDADFGVGGHMTIEVVRFDRPYVWATVGESARLRGSLEGRVLSTSDGAQLVLRMEIEPKGALRLLLGPIGRRMHHAQGGHLAAIRRRLETADPGASELPSERATERANARPTMATRYAAEMAGARARLASVPCDAVETRWGTVQYLDQGEGLPFLLSHGVLGGYDNVRELIDLYVGKDGRAIGPSRFGYLGSTMPNDATPADQADAYAALLDQLQLDRVVMIGFSAGGPAAIQFALRHPERAHALILMSSYLPGMGARAVAKALHPLIRAVAGWQRGWWLLKRFRPERLARTMGVPRGWNASRDPDFLAVREALFPITPKRFGIAFDALVSEPASNGFPLEDIRVPTLLVHAADDPLAPYEHVPGAAVRIRGARLVTLQHGGHLFLQHADEVRGAVRAFLADVMRAGATS